MQLRMYLPEELAPLQKRFKFFIDKNHIYCADLEKNTLTQYARDTTNISVDVPDQRYQLAGIAIKLWVAGMFKNYNLFDIHNAVAMARLNKEKPTWDNVEKYLK